MARASVPKPERNMFHQNRPSLSTFVTHCFVAECLFKKTLEAEGFTMKFPVPGATKEKLGESDVLFAPRYLVQCGSWKFSEPVDAMGQHWDWRVEHCRKELNVILTQLTNARLMKWLQEKDTDNECIVCFEAVTDSPNWSVDQSQRGWKHITKAIYESWIPKESPCGECAFCGCKLCYKCIVDLIFTRYRDAYGKLPEVEETGVYFELHCPNCRNGKQMVDVSMPCKVFSELKKERMQEFDADKRACFLRYANVFKCPFDLKKPIRCGDMFVRAKAQTFHCGACDKKFWDKAAWKKALKCGRCQRTRYCSKTCRSKHKKEHAAKCHPIKAPKANGKGKQRKQKRAKKKKVGSKKRAEASAFVTPFVELIEEPKHHS